MTLLTLTMEKQKIRLGLCTLAVSLVALTLKMLAWWLSGSMALLSDALETVINVVAASFALAALHISNLPPDHNHTYGHGKVEYLSTVIEGVLVVVTAFGIFYAAWTHWKAPNTDLAAWQGVMFNALGGLVNLVWGLTLLRQGRRINSPAVIASGHHIIADVWTTLILIIGVSLIPLTGFYCLDAILSALIALNVLRIGFSVMRASIAGLMDEVPDPATLQKIAEIIASHGGGALQAHDIRARRSGTQYFIDFHLVVPGATRVSEAHAICDCVENALKAHFGPDVTTIHVHIEPESHLLPEGVPIP
ncbi:MAG: cation diffusion facilitator family transporter [Acetobacteraceae bacterium]